MKLVAASSSERDTEIAAKTLASEIRRKGYDDEPDIIFVFADAEHSAERLRSELCFQFREAAIHGGSSCRGVLVGGAGTTEDFRSVGMIAIWNTDGDQGSAIAPLGADAKEAAIFATRKALQNAGRSEEVPDLVWITAAPGCEEQILEGIKEVVGARALIVGGSSADNDVAGNWFQFTRDAACETGIAVSVIFSATAVSSVYQNGLAPSGKAGKVTKAAGRRLIELGAKPAAETYFNWQGREPPSIPEGGTSVSILSETTFAPLGKVNGSLADVPFFLLLHPASLESDGSLEIFANVHEGDTVHLMLGNTLALVERAGRVAAQAKADIEFEGLQCAGALIVFCGGCLLAMEKGLHQIREGIFRELGDIPFLVMFSFGEQGKGGDSTSHHANLMISCTAFGARPAGND